MKKLVAILFLMSTFLMAQTYTIQDFEEPSDSNYWAVQMQEQADTTISQITQTFQTNNSVEGSALTLDWTAQNTESWGGFVKIEHVAPDSMVYDWSAFDSLSFYYYVDNPQSLPGRAHLRLNLYDVSDVPDTTSAGDETEFYYSFHYDVVDDSTSSWQKITMALEADPNYWNGEGFNRTGWTGVSGNDQLDLDKIKGFTFEFSISGSGDGDFSEGTITFDEMHLHGISENPWVIFNGKTLDPTLEGFSWGGAGMEIIEGGGIDPKTNSLQWTQGDVWTGAGWNVNPAKDIKFRWDLDSLKFALKAESGTASPIRLQFESASGNGIYAYQLDITADDQWHEYSVALSEFNVQDNKPDFDPGEITVFQVLSEGNGTSGKKLWFDYLWTGNPPIDVIAPEAPTGGAVVGGDYKNLITWIDVPNEDNASYTVIFNTNPITSIDDEGNDIVARGIAAGEQIATHTLTAPLIDQDVTFYYAVYAIDQAGNDGKLAPIDAITNTARGVAVIAPNFVGFGADGDLSEWADIMPIKMYPEDGSGTVVNNTTIDNNADLSLDAWVAIDDNYLYFACDVEDDVIDVDSTDGESWMRDGVDLFIGLYDQRGPKHSSYKRGEEPDYHFRFSEHQLLLDISGGGKLIVGSEDYYWATKFPTGYIVEGRVSLDTLAAKGGDERFHPVVGMKIPIDYSINDADGDRREGILTLAQANQDQSWNDPSRWVHTWIGDQTVDVTDEDVIINKYSLEQNYPNPFNPTTVIKYNLVENGFVTLKVFNVLGQEVATLVNKVQTAGSHQLNFNAQNLASGVYVYRLEAGSFVSTKKMMLLR